MADQMQLPELYFRARCQSPECRKLLGGFHVPCVGGIIVFSCTACGKTSVFRNEAYGIRAVSTGPLQDGGTSPKAPGEPRRR